MPPLASLPLGKRVFSRRRKKWNFYWSLGIVRKKLTLIRFEEELINPLAGTDEYTRSDAGVNVYQIPH